MTSTYDFVIVGGGTAGLVIANRLSENSTKSVLVLEAGGDLRQDPRVKIPLFFSALLGSEADWGFRTEPQVWTEAITFWGSEELQFQHRVFAELWRSTRRISMVECVS